MLFFQLPNLSRVSEAVMQAEGDFIHGIVQIPVQLSGIFQMHVMQRHWFEESQIGVVTKGVNHKSYHNNPSSRWANRVLSGPFLGKSVTTEFCRKCWTS
jgi:hypothetical protein